MIDNNHGNIRKWILLKTVILMYHTLLSFSSLKNHSASKCACTGRSSVGQQ